MVESSFPFRPSPLHHLRVARLRSAARTHGEKCPMLLQTLVACCEARVPVINQHQIRSVSWAETPPCFVQHWSTDRSCQYHLAAVDISSTADLLPQELSAPPVMMSMLSQPFGVNLTH